MKYKDYSIHYICQRAFSNGWPQPQTQPPTIGHIHAINLFIIIMYKTHYFTTVHWHAISNSSNPTAIMPSAIFIHNKIWFVSIYLYCKDFNYSNASCHAHRFRFFQTWNVTSHCPSVVSCVEICDAQLCSQKKGQKRVYITISDGKARIRDGINLFNALEGYLHWVSGREQATNELRLLQECRGH